MKRLTAALFAIAVVAGTAEARTVFVTPKGEPGYRADGTRIDKPLPFASDAFKRLRPGDVVELLSISPDIDVVTAYPRTRIEIVDIQAPDRPVVIRGLGPRTRIVGRPIDEFRCPMPTDPDQRGCADAPHLSATDPRLLTVSTASPQAPVSLLGRFLEAAPLPLFLTPLLSDDGAPAVATTPSGSRYGEASCFELIGVTGLVFEHLHFQDCWLAAIRAQSSRNLTLRDSFIVGGTFGLAVRGTESNGFGVKHTATLTVERVTWIQDATGYSDPFKFRCKADYTYRDACPGDMWRKLPWGVVHHGAFRHLNGALLGGKHVLGDVVFRNNRVINAYDGIRLTANSCAVAATAPRQDCRYNAGLWISGNLFSYVRDNPVELEHWATNAHIFHNRFHNAHAWLSFDGMGGGPVYVYGNQGWFDDRPASDWPGHLKVVCSRNPSVDRGSRGRFDALLDRLFDEDEGWLKVGEVRKGQVGVEREMLCETSQIGRTLKFSLPELGYDGERPRPGEYNFPRNGPVYVFNNSWFLRAPITGGGAPAHLRHWNNAVQFCEEGGPGYHPKLCDPGPKPSPAECGTYVRPDPGLDRYMAAAGKVPFFECFRWQPFDENGADVTGIGNEFDWDVSGSGFPTGLPAGFEAHGRRAAPGFIAPERGSFDLQPGAPAASSGCRVKDLGDGKLACATVHPGHAFAGAIDRHGFLYDGPGTDRFRPPR